MIRIPALTLSLCCFLFVGCEAAPPSPSSRTPAEASSMSAPTSTTNTPGDDARSAAPRANGAPVCPPPKKTTDPCAAVMTYVKVGGVCCAYGSPCEAPAGQTYSDSACTQPNPH